MSKMLWSYILPVDFIVGVDSTMLSSSTYIVQSTSIVAELRLFESESLLSRTQNGGARKVSKK